MESILFLVICLVAWWLLSCLWEQIWPNENMRFEKKLKRERENKQQVLEDFARKDISPDFEFGSKYRSMLIYNSQKQMFVGDVHLRFNEITSYRRQKEYHTVTTNEAQTVDTITTKVNTGSLVGRAAVGAVLAGPIGAAVGGLTAKKTTTVNTVSKPSYELTSDAYWVYYIHTTQKGNEEVIFTVDTKEDADKLEEILKGIIDKKQ